MRQKKPLQLKKCYDVAFSNDSSLLVTLSRDVVGWDVGSRAKRFRVHPFSHPSSCAIDPSGAYIAAKNTMGQIIVVEAQEGELVQVLDAEGESEGSDICYSPCGEYLVDGSWTGFLTVRSVATGDIVFQQHFVNEMITEAVHNASGDTWCFAHRPVAVDGRKPRRDYISIWQWPLSAPADVFTSPDRRMRSMALSPDGKRLCLLGDQVYVHRLSDKEPLVSSPVNGVSAGSEAAWSPSGEELATVQRHSIVLHHPDTLETKQVIALDYACSVAYSPDEAHLAVGGWSNGLLLERGMLDQ
ncbi:MAG: hypothetical protein JXR29_14020 [Methylothermaceae bacterium]|nr:hypothetical protein [Methylothermaceae bacterium]